MDKPWECGKDFVFILSEVESNCKLISDQSGCSNEMTYNAQVVARGIHQPAHGETATRPGGSYTDTESTPRPLENAVTTCEGVRETSRTTLNSVKTEFSFNEQRKEQKGTGLGWIVGVTIEIHDGHPDIRIPIPFQCLFVNNSKIRK